MNDQKRQERIHQVAKSLKSLHVVGSMQEALVRAKEIVGKEHGNESEKTISELMQNQIGKEVKVIESKESDAVNAVTKDRKSLSATQKSTLSETKLEQKRLDAAKGELDDLHKQLESDKHLHKLESGDVKEVKGEVKDIECALKDTKELIKDAKRVQEKRP